MRLFFLLVISFSFSCANADIKNPNNLLESKTDIIKEIQDYSNITLPRPHEFLKTIGDSYSDSVPESFHFIVWNIYKGQRENWKRDLSRLTQNSELVLLQEAQTDYNQLEYYKDLTNIYKWDMAQSFFRGHEKISTGVITAHKAKSLYIRPLRSPGREPILGTPKTAIFHKFKIENTKKNLCVLNAHLINFVSAKVFNDQIVQLEKVLNSCKGPIIYAGDFNSWMDEKYHLLKKSITRLGLRPVKFKNDRRTRLFPWSPPFDHIFVRGLKVFKPRVHHYINSSDHYPLGVTVKIL